MNYDNIPTEMKALNQWVVYKSYPDKETGKYKKIMYSPVTFDLASSTNPKTWSSFYDALYYCNRFRYKGLAFALSKDITFIDIDHARDKITGEITSPEAVKLMRLLPDTFTESSVSGNGVHILLKGSLPPDAKKRNDTKGLEMYDTNRFVCLTGNLLNGYRELKDYSAEITQINYDFMGKRPPKVYYEPVPCDKSDTELMETILNSRQSAKFKELYNGNISAYPSHSNADAAFVFMLAWWTQDYGQIDRIVRSSGLYRDKWDQRINGGTYGSNLIDNALSSVMPRTYKNNAGSIKSFEM